MRCRVLTRAPRAAQCRAVNEVARAGAVETRPQRGWLVGFALLAALFFGLLYFPYPADSTAVRWLSRYVTWVARAAAACLGLFDPSVRLVDQVVIQGRFPLQIVLDCTALDVQALYLAAVVSAPVALRAKLLGALAGLCFLTLVNLARIVILYWVGVYAPARFDLVHEDLLTFAMLAAACLAFVTFARVFRQ
jgi:exosortase/archaeosortase family protein